MTTLYGILLAATIFVGVPFVFSGPSISEGSALVDGPVDAKSRQTLAGNVVPTEVASREFGSLPYSPSLLASTTKEDGSAATLIDGRSRSLSPSIRLRMPSPSTAVSLYEAAAAPEPQAWPTTRWTCLEIAEAAARQGFTDTVTVAAIAVAESGGSSDALSVTPRERSVGPLQINMRAHPAYSESCLRSLSCALAAAWKISSGGTNFAPWSVYKSGSYLGRCA